MRSRFGQIVHEALHILARFWVSVGGRQGFLLDSPRLPEDTSTKLAPTIHKPLYD